jgi:very-short-patch-repair endonuclease
MRRIAKVLFVGLVLIEMASLCWASQDDPLPEKSFKRPVHFGDGVSVLCGDSPKNSSFSIEKRIPEESSITFTLEEECSAGYSPMQFRQEMLNLHKNLPQITEDLLQEKVSLLEQGLENPYLALTPLDKALGKWVLNLVTLQRQTLNVLVNQNLSKFIKMGFDQLDPRNKATIFLYLIQHIIDFPRGIRSEYITPNQIAYGLKRILKLEEIGPVMKVSIQVVLAYYKARFFQEISEQVIPYRKAASNLKQALECGQLPFSIKVNAQVLLAHYKVDFLHQGSDDIITWREVVANLQEVLTLNNLNWRDRIRVQRLLTSCLLTYRSLNPTYNAQELKNTITFTQNLHDKAHAQVLLAGYKLNFPQYIGDHIITYEQAAQGLKEALLSSQLRMEFKSRAQVFLAVYRFYYPSRVNDSVLTLWDAAQGLKLALNTRHLNPVVRASAQLHLARFWCQERRIESGLHIKGHLEEAIQSGFLAQRDKMWAMQLIQGIDYEL